jgi:membrane-bound metal-dependent hydrolase YbcI (DUF457 family)
MIRSSQGIFAPACTYSSMDVNTSIDTKSSMDVKNVDFNILFFIHERFPFLFLFFFIMLFVLRTKELINNRLFYIGLGILINILIVSVFFYYGYLNLDSYSSVDIYSVPLEPFVDKDFINNGIPNYEQTIFYGLKHILINMENLQYLKFSINGYRYVINPDVNGTCPTLHPHFIKYGNLDKIKGLVVYEGFPLYYDSWRLYVQVPIEYFFELDSELKEYIRDPGKYRRVRIWAEEAPGLYKKL